ncbi:hypothetical protein P3S67_002134 [Capsicum chacoense]
MADTLPECLVHKILSFLRFREAFKKIGVSKTWLQACLTLSSLEFNYLGSPREGKLIDQILDRYRDGKIPIEKFEFLNQSNFRPIYPRIDKWLDVALQNGVRDLTYKGMGSCNLYDPQLYYPLPILTILATTKSLRELALWYCNLKGVSLSTSHDMVIANCYSLRKLTLNMIYLDDNMLQTLLARCPLIETLIIQKCTGLSKIEVLNLEKIKSLTIRLSGNACVAIHAPTLEYLTYSGSTDERSMLGVVECRNLKSLEVADEMISDGFLEQLISRSQFLETLILRNLNTRLENLNLCGCQSLKLLKIVSCKGIEEIGASNLVTLEYQGDHVPQLNLAKESRQLEHLELFLYPNNLNDAWFRKLRKFLSKSKSCSQVTLKLWNCREINWRELKLNHRIANDPQVDTYPQVDVLNVGIDVSGQHQIFLDALLWSCCPRRINLVSSGKGKMIKCFIDNLTDKKNSHSVSGGSKPWHSQLKSFIDHLMYLSNWDDGSKPWWHRQFKEVKACRYPREQIPTWVLLTKNLDSVSFILDCSYS